MTTILENLRTRVEELRSRVEERRAKIRETLGLGSLGIGSNPGILGGEVKLLEDIRQRARARVEEIRARVRELGVGVGAPAPAGRTVGAPPKKVREKDTVKVGKGRTVRVRFI